VNWLSVFLKILGVLLLIEGTLLTSWPFTYLNLLKKVLSRPGYAEFLERINHLSPWLLRLLGATEAVAGLFLFYLGQRIG
jgi:uncharacterized protein YjeT (DUF2065 family)